MRDEITVLILTLNEAPNIGRTLERLNWAKDIVVVDSGSTDETCEILRRFPNVRVFERAFTSHAEQWNYGLKQTGIQSDWILALDADYVISEAFEESIGKLTPESGIGGYQASFVYRIEGRDLRGGIYPPVVVLFRRSGAQYVQDGHTQRIQVAGGVERIGGVIFHDDRKPLSQWLASQARYMKLEADKLVSTDSADLTRADRIRRHLVLAPIAVFFYCFLVRGNFLDGRAGLYYAVQRTIAEGILSLYLLQNFLKRSPSAPN